uniref:EF-hand domain-containing protein n=1 Tax=Branchiostoma floridae TaxID=7739 RepID=C3ZDS7_BRAFL|eukprot:XP_002592872.1 hypothetical protein BRAFLDRAFT_117739 [Branchiostoma floridae]
MTPFLLLFVALATASPVKRQTTGLDADGDGHITIIEVDNAMDLGEVLVALDTDGDMQFTVTEALQFIDHHYFNVLDTNHDHVISFQEIQDGLTLADLFAFYDRNDDGFLYGAEADRIIAMYDAAYGTAAVPAARRQRRQADGLDTSGDGHLTLNECEAGLNLTVVAYALDTDGDQMFTVDEALQFIDHHYFNTLDTNHDHMLSFQELRDGVTWPDLFAFYDRNDDGFLYGAEADRVYFMYNEVQNAAAGN